LFTFNVLVSMGLLWTSKLEDNKPLPDTDSLHFIVPVRCVCTGCGWASGNMVITCRRCGKQYPKYNPMYKQQVSKPSPVGKLVKNHGVECKVSPDVRNDRKLLNADRRSRCFSRSFATQVISPLGVMISEPINEEYNAAPAVRKIVELSQNSRAENDEKVFVEISSIVRQEKAKGTPWQDIADETIMELIIHDVNGWNFVQALISIYGVSTYDLGRFMATPPDEGTMCLIEEVLCQESLDLFEEVLKLDRVLEWALECDDLSNEVKNILRTIN